MPLLLLLVVVVVVVLLVVMCGVLVLSGLVTLVLGLTVTGTSLQEEQGRSKVGLGVE
jgi:hypothetical protein